MVLETVQKKKFSQLNDKRYYFQCGIVSLPFSHPYLRQIDQFKWYKKQKNGKRSCAKKPSTFHYTKHLRSNALVSRSSHQQKLSK